jgi:hypothetical protein
MVTYFLHPVVSVRNIDSTPTIVFMLVCTLRITVDVLQHQQLRPRLYWKDDL